MKWYTLTYRGHVGQYLYLRFEATCDTDARFVARDFWRNNPYCCGFSLTSFHGRYIDI